MCRDKSKYLDRILSNDFDRDTIVLDFEFYQNSSRRSFRFDSIENLIFQRKYPKTCNCRSTLNYSMKNPKQTNAYYSAVLERNPIEYFDIEVEIDRPNDNIDNAKAKSNVYNR